MKINFLLLLTFLLSANLLFGQKAEKVLRITEAQLSNEYYLQQGNAWKKVLEKDKHNADAWLNYFTAARYSNIFNGEPKFELEEIVNGAVQAIPNTFEAHYLKFWLKPWDEEAFSHLEKAYNLDPNRTETYHEFIKFYLIKGDFEKYREFNIKHYNSAANSPGLLSWNYNALVNLAKDAILLTEGDNDTYPAWTLQEAKDFRKDVLVLNTNLLMDKNYRDLMFDHLKLPAFEGAENMERGAARKAMVDHVVKYCKRPIYFGIGLHKNMRAPYEANLYLAGLSFKYSRDVLDEMEVLKKAYEQDFRLDYLKMALTNDPNQVEIDRYSRSYLPGLMKVYKAYKKEENTTKIAEVKNLILLVGEKSNSLEETKKVLAKY